MIMEGCFAGVLIPPAIEFILRAFQHFDIILIMLPSIIRRVRFEYFCIHSVLFDVICIIINVAMKQHAVGKGRKRSSCLPQQLSNGKRVAPL
jgi:hypothetical protein